MRQRLAELLRSGAVDLIFATAVAGGSGYALTLLAGIELGPAQYVSFGVLWSSLFLVVGTVNGLQQEVARATSPAADGKGIGAVRDAVLVIALLVLLTTVATSPFWVPLIFKSSAWWLSIPIALGLVGHTIVTALIGMLHGLRQARIISLAVILDALLRLGLVIAALSLTHDLAPISWALIVPYALVPGLVWLWARRRLIHARVDVGSVALLRHAGTTLLAAAASGAMISGISLLIAGAGREAPAAHVGAVIFAVNITRAPLIIVVSALQNYVVVRLRDRADWRKVLLVAIGAVAGGTLVFSSLVALFGAQLFSFLLHGERIDPVLLALITGSGGLVALMSLTGAALIARGRHTANTTGWLAAAVATGLILFMVPAFDAAVCSALLAGPLIGLAVHVGTIARESQRPVEGPSAPSPVAL